jgi:hypothetical protein
MEEATMRYKRIRQANTWAKRIYIQFEVSKIYKKFKERIDEFILKLMKEKSSRYLVKNYRKFLAKRYPHSDGL